MQLTLCSQIMPIYLPISCLFKGSVIFSIKQYKYVWISEFQKKTFDSLYIYIFSVLLVLV